MIFQGAGSGVPVPPSGSAYVGASFTLMEKTKLYHGLHHGFLFFFQVAFFIDTIVKLLSKSKFHLVDECILL